MDLKKLIGDLAALVDDFDPTTLVPKLDDVFSWIATFARIAVIIGPVFLLAMGLLYFFASPKEANHRLGYRFFWGMTSVEVWRFMQKLAGLVWGALGLLLCLVMGIMCLVFGSMDIQALVNAMLTCLVWEVILVILACLGIDIAVVVLFDKEGNRRQFKK